MNLRSALLAIAVACASPAFAQDEAPAPVLLPDSVSLSIIDGSGVPDDCMYPETITDTSLFEIGCVTMPRARTGQIASQYVGQLGQQGWRQGSYVPGGMTATRTDENNCEHVLNIFPSTYPPSDLDSQVAVIWFALDRAPRCPTSEAQ